MTFPSSRQAALSAASFSITTALTVPLEEITHAIRAVYPDDDDTPEGYAEYISQTQIDLAQSFVALDAERWIAGLAMFAVRGERGWVGDLAVAPRYQKRKLGQALMNRCLENAKRLGLCSVALDVREDNPSARHVYEKIGFRYTRRIPCFRASLAALGWNDPSLPAGVEAVLAPVEWSLDATPLLRWYDPHYAATPCWERELQSLLCQKGARAWTLRRGGREVVFLLCNRTRNSHLLNVQHVALAAEAAPDDLRALCIAAAREAGADALRLGLEPEDSRAAAMFRALGFPVEKMILEMVKTL
ncbi:MAG: GNAT family N-acetyltransferase [Chloroflexi bacterium]|nr:GNAT family N-acetyltransferase [Chloroflexota bacterium]